MAPYVKTVVQTCRGQRAMSQWNARWEGAANDLPHSLANIAAPVGPSNHTLLR